MGGVTEVRARASGRVRRARGSRTSFGEPVTSRLGPCALVAKAGQATGCDANWRNGGCGVCPASSVDALASHGTRLVPPGRFKTAAMSSVFLFVAALGTSGCRMGRADDAAPPKPVAECLQYEAKLNACFHRDASIASQPMLLAKTDADRDRIAAKCSENLKRLETACR